MTESAATPSDAGTDAPIDAPIDELMSVERLERWMSANVEGGPELLVERMGEATGVGNALFKVQWGGAEMVLRRPPLAKVTASAGDSSRERRLLGALADTNVRHPRLIASCDDLSVIGAPFLLMAMVDGFTPIAPLPAPFDTDVDARHRLGTEIVDALAELALVDWRAIGLVDFGKPDGFLARQVDRWLWQLGTYRTREVPGVDEVAAWLRSHLPDPGPIGIMHGDYSMFNVMFAHGAPARLAAIVDWDTATIGETLMDIGHLLARWDEPGEEPSGLGSADNPDRTGLPSRAELAARYAERTGHDLGALRYYEVISLFKLGCIMEGHHAKDAEAPVPTGRFADTAATLFADAARIARGERT